MPMQKTIFEIRKMDCPSEENLIRMKLEGISGIRKMGFDIENRKLTIFHDGPTEPIEQSIHALNLGKYACSQSSNRIHFAG